MKGWRYYLTEMLIGIAIGAGAWIIHLGLDRLLIWGCK